MAALSGVKVDEAAYFLTPVSFMQELTPDSSLKYILGHKH